MHRWLQEGQGKESAKSTTKNTRNTPKIAPEEKFCDQIHLFSWSYKLELNSPRLTRPSNAYIVRWYCERWRKGWEVSCWIPYKKSKPRFRPAHFGRDHQSVKLHEVSSTPLLHFQTRWAYILKRCYWLGRDLRSMWTYPLIIVLFVLFGKKTR